MKDSTRVVLCTLYVAVLTIGPHFVVSEYKHPIFLLHPSWGESFIQHTVAVGAIGYILSGFIGGDIKNRGLSFYTVCGCIWAAMSHALAALGVRYNQLWLFMLGQGFFDTLGGGCLMTVVMTHATSWMDPAIAASVVGGTVGISAAGLSYGMAAMITFVSAEACLWGLTGLACLAALAAPFFRLPPPVGADLTTGLNSSSAPVPDVVFTRLELLHKPQFYFVWFVVALGLTPGFALISTYTALFQTVLDVPYFEAAVFTGVANATYCIGRVLGGIMCRQLGVKKWGFCLLGIGLLGGCLAPAAQALSQKWLFVVGVSLLSMQLGGTQVYAGPLIVFTFGRPNLATVYGLILLGVAFASVVGPVAILAMTTDYLHISDAADKYNVFFFISAGLLAACLGLLVFVQAAPAARHTALASGSVMQSQHEEACDDNDSVHHSGHIHAEEEQEQHENSRQSFVRSNNRLGRSGGGASQNRLKYDENAEELAPSSSRFSEASVM